MPTRVNNILIFLLSYVGILGRYVRQRSALHYAPRSPWWHQEMEANRGICTISILGHNLWALDRKGTANSHPSQICTLFLLFKETRPRWSTKRPQATFSFFNFCFNFFTLLVAPSSCEMEGKIDSKLADQQRSHIAVFTYKINHQINEGTAELGTNLYR